jgi:hypothetical protein
LQGALSDPRYKSDDHEDPDRKNGRRRTEHSDPHCNLHQGQVFGHAGGLMLFAKRFTSSDLMGSETSLVSMKLHLPHSNIRFSEQS